MILYLHGFCSSPQSAKARLLAAHLAAVGRTGDFVCPALSPDPDVAIAQAEAVIAAHEGQTTLVGSSLGGYYALHLAERLDLRAVLVNPAVPAHLDTLSLVGEHHNFYSGEPFTFTAAHQQSLRRLAPPRIRTERYLLLLETGDEVLPAGPTLALLSAARQIVLPGGDHSFTRFAEYLAAIVAFADAAPDRLIDPRI